MREASYFISYQHSDSGRFVREILEPAMSSLEIPLVFDKRFSMGRSIGKAVRSNLWGSGAVIVVIGPNYDMKKLIEDHPIKEEVEYALHQSVCKPLILDRNFLQPEELPRRFRSLTEVKGLKVSSDMRVSNLVTYLERNLPRLYTASGALKTTRRVVNPTLSTLPPSGV